MNIKEPSATESHHPLYAASSHVAPEGRWPCGLRLTGHLREGEESVTSAFKHSAEAEAKKRRLGASTLFQKDKRTNRFLFIGVLPVGKKEKNHIEQTNPPALRGARRSFCVNIGSVP